jgi:hypothetical protein
VWVLEAEQFNDGCEIVTLGDDEGMISEKYVTHMYMCVYEGMLSEQYVMLCHVIHVCVCVCIRTRTVK